MINGELFGEAERSQAELWLREVKHHEDIRIKLFAALIALLGVGATVLALMMGVGR